MDKSNTRIPKAQFKAPAPKLPATKSTSSLTAPLRPISVNKNMPNVKPISTRPYLSRKSKSSQDLRQLQPKLTAKAPLKELNTVSGTIFSTTRKRPAQPVENSKPKVAKVMKPAPYDYKARYNLLNEKHTKVVESLNDAKKQLREWEDYDQLKENFEKFSSERPQLLKRIEELQSRAQQLTTEVLQLVQKCQDLVAINADIAENNTSVKKELQLLKSRHQKALERIDNLSNENAFFKQQIQESNDIRRQLHNDVQNLKGNIRVFCRVRPLCDQETVKTVCSLRYLDDDTTLEIKRTSSSTPARLGGKQADGKCEFNFDKVFAPSATQKEVFEELAQLVQSVIDGYHVCVFAYGQTGSGKTYTMQGGDEESSWGMIPRTINLLFSSIHRLQKSGWRHVVEASFLEIYNENINDLLSPDSKLQYDILFNEGKGITVKNLTIKTVASAEELQSLMRLAHRNRAVAVTNFNEHSSRSHAVTKINVTGHYKAKGIIYSSSISLVDLAGSESAKTTSNERLVETKNINKSLSMLGSVMLSLYNKSSHIPYRNSKLTHLLQSSLGGDSKTLMFVNISPLEECFGESINSLRFASTVKEVKTTARRNKMKLDASSSMQSLCGK